MVPNRSIPKLALSLTNLYQTDLQSVTTIRTEKKVKDMKKSSDAKESSLGSVRQDARDQGTEVDVDTPFVPRQDVVALLLAENVNDHMSLGFFSHQIGTWGGVPAAILRERCIAYLDHMLHEGYLHVGNLLGNTLVPWQKSTIQTLETIQVLWPAEGGRETIRDSAWLANTQLGDEIAKKYVTDGKYPEGA